MQDIYDRVLEMVNAELTRGERPLEVAAILVAVSLRMYRTMLSEAEFEQMVDSISEGRDRIRPLFGEKNPTLQ